jgi:tRNA G10  N-methylase Trm11
MMQTLFILGRQPALGRAELESLYGASRLQQVGSGAMLCTLPPEQLDFARLGGSIKLCSIVGTVDSTDWRKIQTGAIQAGLHLGETVGEGKIQLGISAYDLRVSTGQLNAGGLELKKALRKTGRSVRLVPNQASALNSAQILHNHLTGERGIELVLVRDGTQTIVARTLAEQDIDAYTERDRGRPKRDAFVGMLPPKLAQTIINLAVGETAPDPTFAVLDPFCGTGVVLQEALLMGYGAYGTDLEPRMIDYSRTNLEWLAEQTQKKLPPFKLETGDAVDHFWESVPNSIASEAYLGQPFNAAPSAEKLAKVRLTCNIIIEKFLKNIGGRLKPGTRVCLAIPAWQTKPGQFTHLPLLDHLSDLGYNRIDFRYTQSAELMYYRPDQVVARELLVITRK